MSLSCTLLCYKVCEQLAFSMYASTRQSCNAQGWTQLIRLSCSQQWHVNLVIYCQGFPFLEVEHVYSINQSAEHNRWLQSYL
jgi:hypothetical protein